MSSSCPSSRSSFGLRTTAGASSSCAKRSSIRPCFSSRARSRLQLWASTTRAQGARVRGGRRRPGRAALAPVGGRVSYRGHVHSMATEGCRRGDASAEDSRQGATQATSARRARFADPDESGSDRPIERPSRGQYPGEGPVSSSLTLGSTRVIRARLLIPWRGVPIVDCELDTDANVAGLPTSGPATLSIATPVPSTVTGTLDPRGTGTWGPKASARLIAGEGAGISLSRGRNSTQAPAWRVRASTRRPRGVWAKR